MPFTFGDEQINVDDMVSVTCLVNKGDLPIEIDWWVVDDYGVERFLLTNDGIVITRSSQRMSVLTIESVKARHRGEYICKAKNRAGSVQSAANLAINGDCDAQDFF